MAQTARGTHRVTAVARPPFGLGEAFPHGIWLRLDSHSEQSRQALRLVNMSRAGFLRLLKRANLACVVFVALAMIFSATAFTKFADSNHRSATSILIVSHAVEQPNVAASKTSPCSDDGHGLGQCCSALHCLVGFPVAPHALPNVPPAALVGPETADLGTSLMPGRLDRPPKS